MDLFNEVKNVSKSEYAIGALYVMIIGLLLSDIIPTPADALYFNYERKLRNQYIKRSITPKEYWIKEAGAYYLFNPIYWLIILLIVVNIKGSARRKMKFALIIIGAGAVLGVLSRNIRLDVEELEKNIQENKKQAGQVAIA